VVTTTEAGEATVTCAACATRETYRLPVAARKMTHSALKAVIATEHRSDRAAVTVDRTPGAIAVRCPSCSAPLAASDASKFLTCTFCKVVSRIPDHTWFRMSGKEPVSEAMWLLFHGPSAERKEIERKNQGDQDKARRQALRDERQAERDQERQREKQAEQARKDAADEAERGVEEARRRKRERDVRAYTWMLLVGGAVVSAVVVFFVSRANDPRPPSKTAGQRDSGTSRPSPTRAPPPPPALVSVRSCSCVSASNAGTNTYVLEAPTTGHSAWSFEWTQHAGFVETESTVPLGSNDVGAVVLPPTAGTSKLRLAIACDGPVVALLAGKVATGWAGPRGGRAWTTSLPGTFTPKLAPADPAPPKDATVDVACATPLRVDDGSVALTLDDGKHVHLSLKDGRVK
jgi:hypothetical protein